MKYLKVYKLFESTIADREVSGLLSELVYNTKWTKIENPNEIYPDAIYCYEHQLNERFTVILLIRKSNDLITTTSHIRDEKDGTMSYLDNIFNPYVNKVLYRNHEYNKYTSFAIRLGENQLEYYSEIDKLPSEEELRAEILTDLTDNGYGINKIEYGYVNLTNIKDDNLSDGLAVYHKDYKYRDFRCVVCIEQSYVGIYAHLDDFKEGYGHMLDKLKFYGNYTCQYYISDFYGGLLILIGNK